MNVSKRSLGEGYIVGTGAVLAVILVAQALQGATTRVVWNLAWGVPVITLISAVAWLQQFDLSSDQVWVVAEYSASGLGVGTVVLFLVEIFVPATPVSTVESILLGTTLSTMAVAGAFAGVVTGVQQESRELKRRNTVLNRVLRHNLRNDMSVVMCMLDSIENKSDGEHEAELQQAREKIDSLVELTDKVRKASAPATDTAELRHPKDVTALVEQRVSYLKETNPDLEIRTEMPESALACVDDSFGLIIDNIAESALSRRGATPELAIRVKQSNRHVTLCIDDCSQTLPQADLAAVAAGAETALEHAHGVELWLVDWLVEASGGDLTFETDGTRRRLSIKVDSINGGIVG